MAKARPSLLDDVLARAVNKRPGFATWFERLPADAQSELDAVRESYDPAIHQKRAYAAAIMDAARDRGWNIGGEQAVIAWLKKQR